MSNQIPTVKRCPPKVGDGSTVKKVKSVRVSTLVQSLKYIQDWAGEVRMILQNIPGDPVIPVPHSVKKPDKKKTTKKKATKKTAAKR